MDVDDDNDRKSLELPLISIMNLHISIYDDL